MHTNRPAPESSDYSLFSDYMLGGRPVEKDDKYPWIARIYLSRRHLCGGVLLAARTVLTAGHCVVDNPIRSKYRVAIGSPHLPVELTSYNDPLGNARLYGVEKILLHPQFTISEDRKFAVNDFALLFLNESLPVRMDFPPICLPNKEKRPRGADGVIVGWGQINSLIDALNKFTRVSVERTKIGVDSNPEGKMYNSLVTLIPGSDAFFMKNLKVKKDITAVKENITHNYENLLRKVNTRGIFAPS